MLGDDLTSKAKPLGESPDLYITFGSAVGFNLRCFVEFLCGAVLEETFSMMVLGRGGSGGVRLL